MIGVELSAAGAGTSCSTSDAKARAGQIVKSKHTVNTVEIILCADFHIIIPPLHIRNCTYATDYSDTHITT